MKYNVGVSGEMLSSKTQSKDAVSIDDLLSASTIHGLSQIPRKVAKI